MVCPHCHQEHEDNAKYCPITGEIILQTTDCPHCGNAHPINASFCPLTGSPLIQSPSCPNCGQYTEPDWVICAHCGKPLQDRPIVSGKTKTSISVPPLYWKIVMGVVLILVTSWILISLINNVQSRSDGSILQSLNLKQQTYSDVESAIRDVYARGNGAYGWKLEKVTEIEVTGEGKVPPNQYNTGVEAVYCVNVKIDASNDQQQKYIWFSYIVERTGNFLDAGFVDFSDYWYIYSCPGDYKGV